MSSAAVLRTVRTEFARDADTGEYVLAIVDTGSEALVVSIRLLANAVEAVVCGQAGIGLELRSNGTVTAFLDRGDAADLATKPLAELVAEALEVLSLEDDFEDLTSLEHALEVALSAVRSERRRLRPQLPP